MEKNYLVIDLGTGNSRVGLVSSKGKIYGVRSHENIYYRDDAYEDAQYFYPEEWKQEILKDCEALMSVHPGIAVAAVTATGARESIVLYDEAGQAFLGLPNIDNRGRKWIKEIPETKYIYKKTGRWVTEDFPAAKLLGLQKEHAGLYGQIKKITSLSEWIGEIFTGKIVIEPSQACETQLLDIETLTWSGRICDYYGIKRDILPPLQAAGTSLGEIREELQAQLCLPKEAVFLVGGADTQVALKGAGITAGDIGIVSGTTSPVVTIVDDKYTDEKERCWTDCNLGGENYQVETNPGVTGLNYQKMKKMFFEHRSYQELDQELEKKERFLCTASFSSLYFSEKQSLKRGGFLMSAPLDLKCEATDLLWAVVADIACSIYVQYQSLCEMIPHQKSYILGCGGGLQSAVLCQMLADLAGKELVIYEGYEQASIQGCIKICNGFFDIPSQGKQQQKQIFTPAANRLIHQYYEVWNKNRQLLNPIQES